MAPPRNDRLVGAPELPVRAGACPFRYRSRSLPLSSNFDYRTKRMNGDIDIREEEHVVVGKSGLTGSDNAIVLVLSATIVE